MKKDVAFLLAFLIFVTPMTTLVKADVVIGDNDETIINENATILGRKLALMESLSDLALSGVTEYTISNTTDVDSYLDSLWSEVNDAINYLGSGEWANDINDSLASKYFTNLVQYKDYINNRGEYLAHLLPSGNPTTNLLSTFFANNIFGKHSTLQKNLSLDTFRALSALNSNPSPNPDPNYLTYIDRLNNRYLGNPAYFWFYDFPNTMIGSAQLLINPYDYSWGYYGPNGQLYGFSTANYQTPSIICGDIIDLNITNINGTYHVDTSINVKNDIAMNSSNRYRNTVSFNYSNGAYSLSIGQNNVTTKYYTYSGTLADCLEFCCQNFKNVNLYVDGVAWSIVSNTSNAPTLDIDGYLKIYGNDNPQQYELQPNTSIDYDQLYQVIYNAIRDNLPISQGDINYYDSHDTIYSPTIINNYGEEDGNESDLIDTILDYAVIPKFDTAIAQPMRAALTNGVVIMQNSITNVIPNEILLILGACFFLLLFAVVINRMIK